MSKGNVGRRIPRIGAEDKPCPYCGQLRASRFVRCTAKCKRRGAQCRNAAVEGWTVCEYHGAGKDPSRPGGRPSTNFLYSKALEANPELKAAYDEVVAAGGSDEFDLSHELLLARARLGAAISAGTLEPEHTTKMLEGIMKAVQKNVELKIKLQGLVQKADAEKLLKSAIRVIIPYIPESLKVRCFEDITAVLSGSHSVLSADNVIVGELGPGEPV